DRATGFESAYADAGAPRPRVLETDDLSALGAYRAMTRDLARSDEGTRRRRAQVGSAGARGRAGAATADDQPSGARGTDYTAVFAATDELANGVIAALTDAGLRVPSDVS